MRKRGNESRKLRAGKFRSRIRNGLEKLEKRVAPGAFLDVLAGAGLALTAEQLMPYDPLADEPSLPPGLGGCGRKGAPVCAPPRRHADQKRATWGGEAWGKLEKPRARDWFIDFEF